MHKRLVFHVIVTTFPVLTIHSNNGMSSHQLKLTYSLHDSLRIQKHHTYLLTFTYDVNTFTYNVTVIYISPKYIYL